MRTEAFRAAVAGAVELRQEMLRLFGIPESEIAETLRLAEDAHRPRGRWRSRRACAAARSRSSPASRPRRPASYERFVETVRERHADTLFSDDGRTVDQQVADLLRARGLTIATAESCTGGLLAARLTDLAGSSDYVLGGLVVYSNEAKVALAGVDPGAHRARGRRVGRGRPRRWPTGARAALDADVGVGITGVAGPGGGTPEKPVGLVCFSVAGRGRRSRLTRVGEPARRAGPTSATARPPSPCTWCGGCSSGP